MLSCFSAHRVMFEGAEYMTAEHAYQTAKFAHPGTRERIKNAPSAYLAREWAQMREGRVENFDENKVALMKEVLRAKLQQHEDVKGALLETGDAVIVKNHPLDDFWGSGPDGNGENVMGKIWMELRAEIKQPTEAQGVRSKKILTLCIVHQGDNVLLAMKKRGFGVGRWNGFGGKVQEGETIEQAARRETKEEAGIELSEIAEKAVITFEWQTRPDVLEVHVFKAVDFSGEPTETEEMRPQWFAISDIPYDEMWSDDRYWLGYFLADKPVRARFLFDGEDRVVEHQIEEIVPLGA